MKAKLLLMFLLLPASVVAQTSGYAGYKHKPFLMGGVLPNGVKSMGGAMIMEGNEITKYGIGRFIKGRQEMLWLELVTREDEKGPTEWQVKDVLTFPALTKNQELFFGVGNDACTINGKNDERLVVFVQLQPRTSKYTVRKAWRVDLKTEKFNAIPVAGIKCVYDEP